MLTAYQLLNRDLDVFDEMLFELEAYLHGRDNHWELANPEMPLLTLGGMLMRHQRLTMMQEQLDFTRLPWFEQASGRFKRILRENVVDVERRAHAELHLLVYDWMKYISVGMGKDPIRYTDVAESRVVIEALFDLLKQPPYKLDQYFMGEMQLFDENLRQRWQSGEFVWPLPYQQAYPPEKYWWLYGQVVTASVAQSV